MADQTATYGINAEGNLSGEAAKATEALEKLEHQMAADTKELAAMQKALKNLEKAAVPNKELIGKLTEKVKATKESLAHAQANFIGLGGAFKKSAPPGAALANKLKELGDKASQMPGPLGGLIGKLMSMRELLVGGVMAAGAAAVAAGLVAISVAALKAAKSLYEYGTAAADAARSELLQLEGLTKMRFLFQRTAGNAKEMQAAIDDIAAKTPTARGELVKYTNELYRMGLRGSALTKTLEAVSIKHATQGAAAAQATAGWAAGLNATGKSVDGLVNKVKGKLGGIAAQQMKSLTVQTEKQKEAFDMLFTGVDMEKYLGAWKEVKDLMSQSTESGKALKFLMTTLLQPLIDQSATGASVLKVFFQELIIKALQVTIAILRVRKWMRETFADNAIVQWAKDNDNATKVMKVAMGGLIAVFTALGVAALILAFKVGMFLLPVLWALAAPFAPFILAALGVGLAISALIVFWDDLVKAFQDLDWAQAGIDVIKGIMWGLSLGPTLIYKAMTGLGSLAIGAFKKAIGAASPAKAFIAVGTTIPQGVAEGVDAGAPQAEQATANMLDASSPKLGAMGTPAGGAPPGSAAAGGRAGGGAPVTIGEIHVHATSDKPEQMALDFRRELERVLAGFAAELGAPEPQGAA